MQSRQRMGLQPLPFTYEEWKKKTELTIGRRDSRLAALDLAIKAYEVGKSPGNLRIIENAFFAWRRSSGMGDEWKRNARNKKTEYFSLLYSWLYSVDLDVLAGSAQFMVDDMANARAGILWFFSKLECERGKFQIVTGGVFDMSNAGLTFGATEAGKEAGKIVTDVRNISSTGVRTQAEKLAKKLDARGAGTKAADPPSTQFTVDSGILFHRSPEVLSNGEIALSDKIFGAFKQAWDAAGNFIDENTFKDLRALTDFLVKRFLSTVANATYGVSMNLATAVNTLVEAVFQRYKAWQSGQDVQVVDGTPATIVHALETKMSVIAAQNLYATLRSGVQFGLQVASLGAAHVVSFVVSAVEVLIKTAYRLYELHLFRKFVAEAKEKFQGLAALKIHQDPIAFNTWFKYYATRVPLISALILNSGAINKMHLLKMFAGRCVINQSQYDAGVKYLARLHNWSAKYIEDSGYKVYSADEIANQWAKPRKDFDSNYLNNRKYQLYKFGSAFLSGGSKNIVTGVAGDVIPVL